MSLTILAVSTTTIRCAQQAILSCEACNSAAELPFDWVLDEVTGCDGSVTDYILTEGVRCPRCGCGITEKTLVEIDGKVFAI